MSGPDRSVAQVRSAVRAALMERPTVSDGERAPLALVAVSGGADSLALAAATAFVAPRLGWTARAVVVDHGIQSESATVSDRAARIVRRFGVEADVVRADVRVGGEGPEAAARRARYTMLQRVADERAARVVLLGHTRDDQAESVLLGLLRGSGTRSLAGMATARGIFARPLLHVPATTTRAACAALGVHPWSDPHNQDRSFARVRVRTLLRALEADVGPGMVAALARSADQLRADADALDAWSVREFDALLSQTPDEGTPPIMADDGLPPDADVRVRLPVSRLAALPLAVRARVLRLAGAAAGAAPLTSVHLAAMSRLIDDWRGQGAVALPAERYAIRRYGTLVLWTSATWRTNSRTS